MRLDTRPTIIALALGLLAAGAPGAARAQQQPNASPADTGTVSQQKDTSAMAQKRAKRHKKGGHGYRSTGARTDTTLHKPGTQTGRTLQDTSLVTDTSLSADTSAGVETGRVVPADTSTYTPPRSDSGMYAPPDSALYAPPRSDSGTYAPPPSDRGAYAPPTATTNPPPPTSLTTTPPSGTTPVQPPNSSSPPPER